MKLIDRLKKLKEVAMPIQEPNISTIKEGSNSIYIDINGIPRSIAIYYSGYIGITKNLNPIFFRIKYGKSKITITNLFGAPINNKLFTFFGSMNIKDCDILTYSGRVFKASIDRDIDNININRKKTNFEDDTEILREDYTYSKATPSDTRYAGGYNNPTINPNVINPQGYYQQLEKLDEKQIASQTPLASDRKIMKETKTDTKTYRAVKREPVKPVVRKEKRDTRGGKY